MSSYFRNRGVAREQLGLSVFDNASLADPNADRVMFWDDSAGALTWLGASTHLEISGTDLRVTEAARTSSLFYVIDGGGAPITTGIKGDLHVPFACTITKWTLLADQVGSIVIDLWKRATTSGAPTVAHTITASAKPTLSSSDWDDDSTLTGWTTSVTANDRIRFNVDSITTVTRVMLSLTVVRT